MPRFCVSAALLLVFAFGCEDDRERSTIALFALPVAPDARLFATPFPNDLLKRDDGTLDLRHLAAGQAGLVQRYLDGVAKNSMGGYSTNGAAFFRFSGALDSGTLPDTPRASLDPSSAIRWVNIDPASAAYGEVTPISWRFRARGDRYIGDHSLAVLPEPGFVLDPETTYAVLLFDTLRDERGLSVRSDEHFAELLSDAPPNSAHERSHRIYAPLRRYIGEFGLTGVVSAAVFTTGRPTAIAEHFAEAINRLPVPRVDELVVVDKRDGFYELRGTFLAPVFQGGNAPYTRPEDGGLIELAVDGRPMVSREMPLRFALTLPEGAMPANGWPVLFYAHGTGGDYRSFIRSGLARDLAQVRDDEGQLMARLAVISIDQVSHGERGDGTSPELAFFNITNPEAAVHNVLQGAADGHVIASLLSGIILARVGWADESERAGQSVDFAGGRFDMGRFGFLGHSQGALTGSPFLAYSDAPAAAVLSGGGAVAMLSLLDKSQPVDIGVLIQTLLSEAVDRFHPMLTLMQQLLDPADPANYVRQMVGPRGKHLLITQGIEDHHTPLETTDALAIAASLPILGQVRRPIAGLELLGVEAVPLPVVENIETKDRALTAGVLQEIGYDLGDRCGGDEDCPSGGAAYCDAGVCRRDGHFVLFDQPALRTRVARFFATFARDGTPRVE